MAEAYENAGVHVFDEEFKRLFDAPVLQSPDLKSPGFTDGYVTAYERYRDPLYLRTVAMARRQPVSCRPAASPTILPHRETVPAPARRRVVAHSERELGRPAHRVLKMPIRDLEGLPPAARFRIAYGYKQSGSLHRRRGWLARSMGAFVHAPRGSGGVLMDRCLPDAGPARPPPALSGVGGRGPRRSAAIPSCWSISCLGARAARSLCLPPA